MSASTVSVQGMREERAWRACARKPVVFAEGFWYIRHPSKGKVPFELRDAQREALDEWAKGGNWLTLKARQIGWSTLIGFFCVWIALFKPDSQIILLSRTERESVKLMNKCLYGYKHLPEWMKERVHRTNDHQQKMIFSNGSSIESLPSASDPARGESASLVVIDEWAFLPNGEEAWASIEPVADIGGQIIGLSTANGVGNFFHTHWMKAKSHEIPFSTMFYGWWAVPERTEEWYAAKKAELPEWQLHQEYPDSAEEAFIKSGRPVFNLDALREMETRPPSGIGYISEDGNWFPTGDEGVLSIWEMPIPNRVYAIGADVAAGLGHGDYSSAHVLDIKTGNVVAHYHGHPDPDEFGEDLVRLGHMYHGAMLTIEANNHGLTTITRVRKMNYPRIFRRRKQTAVDSTISSQYGFLTTQVTKPEIINDLGAAIREHRIHIPCEDTRYELSSYVRNNRGRMDGSPFDDRVISLALAVHTMQFLHQPEQATVIDTSRTLAYWESKLKPDERQPMVMGAHNVRGN